MWYAIQTETGKEQKLVDVISILVEPGIYERCFLMKREAVWRLHGRCIIHRELLFPGYVFVETAAPDEFYIQLKKIPYYARLLGKEAAEFHPVSKEEQEFLESLLGGDEDDTVRLSPVTVDGEGGIVEAGGALGKYRDFIVKKRLRLRYVAIRIELFGRQRDIYMGICLPGDKDISSGVKDGVRNEDVSERTSGGEGTGWESAVLARADGTGSAEGLGMPECIDIGAGVVIQGGAFEGVRGIVREIDSSSHTVGVEIDVFGSKQIVRVEYSEDMERICDG